MNTKTEKDEHKWLPITGLQWQHSFILDLLYFLLKGLQTINQDLYVSLKEDAQL